jgi:hypothetical protein
VPRDYEPRIAAAPAGAAPEGGSVNDYEESVMKLTKVAAMLALATGVAGAQFGASSVLAGPPDDREVYEMLKKSGMMRSDGMVTKADFLKLMEKRFDAMDKGRKGMLSAQEIAKLLDPNLANP